MLPIRELDDCALKHHSCTTVACKDALHWPVICHAVAFF